MTGRELLTMHRKISGFRGESLHIEVQKLLGELELLSCADSIVSGYSCGARRKLSLGIALAGEPRILVIDGKVLCEFMQRDSSHAVV